jgi:hypothetical protein
MNRADFDPVDELARMNPVDASELRTSISLPSDRLPSTRAPRRRTRNRVALVASTATVTVVALLLALPSSEQGGQSPDAFLRASAAVAAEQPSLALDDDEFARRASTTWMLIPPGESLGGRRHVRESGAVVRETTVLLNQYGGGDFRDRLARRTDCTFVGEVLAKVLGELSFLGCRGGPVADLPLLDERLGIDRGPLAPGALGAAGPAVDDLPADPTAIGRALEEQSEQPSLGFRNDPPASERGTVANRLRSVAELLANPVASPEVRAAAFEYAASLPGMTLHDGATDPLGRSGVAVAVERPSWETSQINFGWQGNHRLRIDFGASDTVVRDEVIIDPETSDVLATRSFLVSTDLEGLRQWLEGVGAPALVAYKTYEPVTVESRPDLVRSKSVCPNGTVIIHDAPAPPEGRTDLCDGHERR